MGRRRSAWLGLACGLLVAGCTYTAFPAEWTAAACLNDEDDDRDGKYNCEDPDCWGFAHCQPHGDAGAAGEPSAPPQLPPMTDDPLVPPWQEPTTDASMVDMMTPDAHVTPHEPDASVDAEVPTLECSKYCPPGQCNDDGSCGKPLAFGTFDVASITFAVPGIEGITCFDDRIVCRLQGGCCDPDPIVTIHVGDVKAGFKLVPNTREMTVEDVDMQLELREGDQVHFKVEDEDTLAVGDEIESTTDPIDIFVCSTVVTEDMIEAGSVGCEPDREAYSFPAEGHYFVAASLTPLADDGGEDHPGDMP